MSRVIACLVAICLLFPQIALAGKAEDEANARGAAMIFGAFHHTLRQLNIEVKELLPSYFKHGAHFQYWVTVVYVDDSYSGDMTRLGKVIAACHSLAKLMEIDLVDIEARPVSKDFNVRASILAQKPDDADRREKWYQFFTGKALTMSDNDRELAMGWQEGWTRRIFDPQWVTK